MKQLKSILFLALLLSCLTSCDIEDDRFGGTAFKYLARKVNYMWADNLRCKTITIEEITGDQFLPLTNNESVKLSEYMLGFSTCNVDVPDIPNPAYQENFYSGRYDPLWASPYMMLQYSDTPLTDLSDPAIENLIRQHHAKLYQSTRSTSSSLATNLVPVDYRLSPLSKINITCSQDLFGVKSGETLNDFFEIRGYPSDHYFIVTSNKNLIDEQVIYIGISQYLSYSPLAPAAMYFTLKKGLSLQTTITVEFTIELEVDGNKTLSATTKPITITP